jgi:hypothetical protein
MTRFAEHAVLHGEITRIERDEPRGTKYVIEGIAADEPLFVGSSRPVPDDGTLLDYYRVWHYGWK